MHQSIYNFIPPYPEMFRLNSNRLQPAQEAISEVGGGIEFNYKTLHTYLIIDYFSFSRKVFLLHYYWKIICLNKKMFR